MMRHGGQVVVDALVAHGVARVFTVPGESFLPILDALHDAPIRTVVCRHEGGAAMMAEATGKLTGRPGIAIVTRGPGATNAAAGVHVARQDSTPMILLVGQIARGDTDREAFQELDYRAVFGGLAKWAAQVDDPARLPEYLARAFHVAVSGRPGPVVLALPEDVLAARVDAPDLPVAPAVRSAPAPAAVDILAAAIAAARRPLVVAGGGVWSDAAAEALGAWAEAWGLPVAVAFRRQAHVDNRRPCYVGDLGVGMNPALGRALAEADLVVALGTRLGDTATAGYTLRDPARPGLRIAMIHPEPDQIGRLWRADPGIAADPRAVALALATRPAPAVRPWADWAARLRAGYEDWQRPHPTPGAVRMESVIGWLSANLPADAIVTNGAGNYAAFLHRYFRFKRFGTQLAPTSGSMGYGLPAAIAAALDQPGRTVVALAGDGCVQMTAPEMSTAAQHGARLVLIVADNGRYGTIRMHQERHFPGRVSGTDLANPDFAALARACGWHGETVTDGADFPAAYARAAAAPGPALLALRLDPQALTAGATLDAVRAEGLAAAGR